MFNKKNDFKIKSNIIYLIKQYLTVLINKIHNKFYLTNLKQFI